MVNIVLGCDSNGHDDAAYQSTVANILEKAGHTVEKCDIQANAFASYSDGSNGKDPKGKVGIYLIAAGTYSIADATYGTSKFTYNYFGIRPECSPNWDVNDFDTAPIGADPDCPTSLCAKVAGHSFKEINEIVKEKSMVVTGKDANEMGKALVDAIAGKGFQGGGTATGTESSGGTAILIPDKTFYGLIKQIMGAVDAIFIIANNMAYLLSFKDMYKYRDKYKDLILELKPSDIISDSIVRNWTSEGFYNAVEVEYSGGIIKYQHDALINVYGENVFYYSFPEDDEETAKAKANALLSAHVRDYSLDLQLNCIYNPNITVGSWIKIPKTLTKVSGATSQTTGELDKTKPEEKKTRKGVTIENIIETTQKDENGKPKTIQKIKTSDGEKLDVEISSDDYEIFFVQGYRMRWTPNQSPIMSLHLKYGPDTPEDPVNATIGTGGVQSGGTGGGGGYGNDCFYICEIMPNNNEKIGEHGPNPPDLHKAGFEPQAQHSGPRCKKGSNLDKDMAGKTPQEVHNAVRAKFGYCRYADSSSLWPCVSDMYDQACGTNCGDGARILKCALDAINIKSWGVHVYDHYFCAAEINGEWVCLDATGSYEWSNTAGWPAGPKPDGCCEPNQQATADTC